jgi:hypothetical protein
MMMNVKFHHVNKVFPLNLDDETPHKNCEDILNLFMKRFSLTIDGQKFQQNVQCISPQIIEHKKRPGHMPMTIRFWLGKGTTM